MGNIILGYCTNANEQLTDDNAKINKWIYLVDSEKDHWPNKALSMEEKKDIWLIFYLFKLSCSLL